MRRIAIIGIVMVGLIAFGYQQVRATGIPVVDAAHIATTNGRWDYYILNWLNNLISGINAVESWIAPAAEIEDEALKVYQSPELSGLRKAAQDGNWESFGKKYATHFNIWYEYKGQKYEFDPSTIARFDQRSRSWEKNRFSAMSAYTNNAGIIKQVHQRLETVNGLLTTITAFLGVESEATKLDRANTQLADIQSTLAEQSIMAAKQTDVMVSMLEYQTQKDIEEFNVVVQGYQDLMEASDKAKTAYFNPGAISF